ncbi:hypothetical protein [Actinopolymorpha pittospori]|uniref:Uncharacterized protein YxjI n=1 Tax=Actinopolymorpha pittospori TaxID=648752 RepID=A0A927N283_9ACTN|nr:hypothetical protein [Actinopolymorpha pittospori]MBE1611301.1 uncharacterized protein YxjI [Actinopolymorpha pittospori]
MDDAEFQSAERFEVRQRFTMMVNRYEVWTSGQRVAIAQQKRMAFREQVMLYADEERSVPLFGFKARSVVDLGATYDVTAADGTPVGWFRKDFAQSFLRSTWHLGQPGLGECVGQERSQVVAIARRVLDSLPWPYHFDFQTPDGRPVMSVERRFGLRDHYDVTVSDPTIDRRLVCAMAVGLDALQAR